MAKWNEKKAKQPSLRDLINQGIDLPPDITADVKQFQHGSKNTDKYLSLLLYLGRWALPAFLRALSDEHDHDLVKPLLPFIEEVEREIERKCHPSECSPSKEELNRGYKGSLNGDDVVKSKCNSQANEPVTNKIFTGLLNLGNNAFIPVYRAYKCNDDFAKFLQPTVNDLSSTSEELKIKPSWHPSEWPPKTEEHDRMKERKVTWSNIDIMKDEYSSKDNYPMKERTRGRVLIINNIDFVGKSKITGTLMEKRAGAEHDEEQIKDLFLQLHFTIVPPHRNKTADEMKQIVEEEKTNSDHGHLDCFICVIMSHGCKEGIYGVDGDVVDFETLCSQFDSKNCPALNEKPKLFFVQACRGDNVDVSHQSGVQVSEDGVSNKTDGDEVDSLGAGVNNISLGTEPCYNTTITGASTVHSATSLNIGSTTTPGKVEVSKDSEVEDDVSDKRNLNEVDTVKSNSKKQKVPTVHSHADFLFAFATTPDYVTYRHQKKGSWFLQAVVWVFKYCAHKYDIFNMLVKVSRIIGDAKAEDRDGDFRVTIPMYRYSLRKNFYFFPGMVEDPPTRP